MFFLDGLSRMKAAALLPKCDQSTASSAHVQHQCQHRTTRGINITSTRCGTELGGLRLRFADGVLNLDIFPAIRLRCAHQSLVAEIASWPPGQYGTGCQRMTGASYDFLDVRIQKTCWQYEPLM
jgi:hypothetical protein